MTESNTPPAIPKKSALSAAAWVALPIALVAGWLGWTRHGADSDPAAPAAGSSDAAMTATPPRVEYAPPPPPEPIATPAPVEVSTATAKVQRKAAPDDCASPCNGVTDSTFKAALRQRAGLARSCYDAALRQNAGLEGKLTVNVRVSPTGRACSATVGSDSLGSATASACILSKFKTATYPRPRGGCADAAVPLNFVAKR